MVRSRLLSLFSSPLQLSASVRVPPFRTMTVPADSSAPIDNFSITVPSSSGLSGGRSNRYLLTLPPSAPSQNTLSPPLPNSPQHHFLHPPCFRSAAAYSRRLAALPFQSIGVLYMTGPLYASDIGVAGTDLSAEWWENSVDERCVLGVPGVLLGRKRTGQSESLLCENSERNGRKAP